MSFSGPDQVVTSIEKVKLLGFLKRSHGKADKRRRRRGAEEDHAQPQPQGRTHRRRRQEQGHGRRGRAQEGHAGQADREGSGGPVTDERAEILRKLEESKQRNLAEQQKLAEVDKRRAEEAEKCAPGGGGGRAPEGRGSPRRCRGGRSGGGRRPRRTQAGRHAWPRPSQASGAAVAPRVDDRNAPKHKTRGSHAMVAGVEDDDAASRFAGQLHLSASERARRTTGARGKTKPRRHVEQARSGGGAHGFSKPTAPIVREVAIGDTITVADLAQKLALKGGDVVKALFKMGVMATITQTIDYDTAALVTEELGHIVVKASEIQRRRRAARARRRRPGRQGVASAGGHHHGPRRPRQDLVARLHPPHQGRLRRSRRHHPAHRRIPRRNAEGRDQLPRHPGPRGVHADACARRQAHRYRGAGRRRRRRRDAADEAKRCSTPRRRRCR